MSILSMDGATRAVSPAMFSTTTSAEAHAIDVLLGMSPVAAVVGDAEGHARAFMTMLERPYVHGARDQELFTDLQRRYEMLRDWYASRAQWRVERQVGTMRLRRVVDQPLVSHGMMQLTSVADYEVLCLILYYAEGLASPRFTLTGLTASITRETRRDDGTPRMPWTERHHRIVLKRALDVLGRLGVVVILDGNMEAYVDEPTNAGGGGAVEALLERGPYFRLFAASIPDWLTDEHVGTGDPMVFDRPPHDERLLPHHRLYRALLTGPALYRDLDPEAFAILLNDDAREFVAQDLLDQFGSALELTRDYAALVRPKSERNRGQTYPERNDMAMLVLLAAQDIRTSPLTLGTSGRVTVDRVWFSDCLQRVRDNPSFSLGVRIRDLGRTVMTDEAIQYLERAGVALYDDTRKLLTLLPVFARVVGQYDTSIMATRPDRGENASDDTSSALAEHE